MKPMEGSNQKNEGHPRAQGVKPLGKPQDSS